MHKKIELVFIEDGKVILSNHYNCDRCDSICAVNPVIVVSVKVSEAVKWSDSIGALFLKKVDTQGGANDDGDSLCSSCLSSDIELLKGEKL